MSLCRFGYPVSPGSPLVFFCDDEATESFNQPVPGPVGYAVNVRVCDAHAEHLVFLARETRRELYANFTANPTDSAEADTP